VSSRRQESTSGFKSFRQDFNATIENMNPNSSKLVPHVENLEMNETRYEDAECDDRSHHEAQNQDRELQKMQMDFEESDNTPGQQSAQDSAPQREEDPEKAVEQLYDPYLDPDGSRFVDEHQIQVQHDSDWEEKLEFLQNCKQVPASHSHVGSTQVAEPLSADPHATDPCEDRIDFYSHRIDESQLNDGDRYDSEGCEFQDFEDQALHDIQNNSVYEKNTDTLITQTGQSSSSANERKQRDLSSKLDKQLTNQIVEEANFEEEEDSVSSDNGRQVSKVSPRY